MGFLFLGVGLIFILNTSKPLIKGYLGEKILSLYLHTLPKKKYKVFNDVLIKAFSYGNTTQIDHIVVSNYGVFVIETKNYKGLITGTERSGNWTQHLGRTKIEFKNPIIQNQIHTEAIKSIINCNVPIISIVAFSPRSTLKITSTTPVVKFKKLKSVIKKYDNVCLDDEKKQRIIDIISEKNISSFIERKKHVKYAKKARKDSLKSEGTCPLCGSGLIKRESKNGNFIGCTSYPKCHYIKK